MAEVFLLIITMFSFLCWVLIFLKKNIKKKIKFVLHQCFFFTVLPIHLGLGAWLSEFMFISFPQLMLHSQFNQVNLICFRHARNWKCSIVNAQCAMHDDKRKWIVINPLSHSDDYKKYFSHFASTFYALLHHQKK